MRQRAVLHCPVPMLAASAWCREASRALLGCLLGLASAAWAADAPVHRCGNSYSFQPCPGGTVLDVADPRSAAQQRESRDASARDAALARQMKAERMADERAVPKGGAANLGPVTAPTPARAASKPHQTTHKKAKKPAKSASAAGSAPAAR